MARVQTSAPLHRSARAKYERSVQRAGRCGIALARRGRTARAATSTTRTCRRERQSKGPCGNRPTQRRISARLYEVDGTPFVRPVRRLRADERSSAPTSRWRAPCSSCAIQRLDRSCASAGQGRLEVQKEVAPHVSLRGLSGERQYRNRRRDVLVDVGHM